MTQRIIALVPDAFGGRGGMALYNRHFLRALCSYPAIDEVVVIPRDIVYELEEMPSKLKYQDWAAGTKLRYVQAVLNTAVSSESAALIICGHLNLLPLAHLLGLRFRCPVLPVCYGAEAYTPTEHRLANYLCHRLDAFIAIRKLTADRLKSWADIPDARFYYLPNCVDLARYGVAPPRRDLVAKYGLESRPVIMTVGRIDSTEKRKGFDEVIETLPLLLRDLPTAVYLAIGDGNDRPRLEAKARTFGVADHVVFAGYVSDAEKADHYRLADVFAMPGSDPYYFDRYPYRFVFLEPLACGVPVVGSTFDCPTEREDPVAQQLVIQVDPNDPNDIKRGILQALQKSNRSVHPFLSRFSYEAFEETTHAILKDVIGKEHAGVPMKRL